MKAEAEQAVKSQEKRLIYVLLLGVLILGGFLRFANISRQGLFEHDEAAYLLEAQFLSSSFAYVRENAQEIRKSGLSFADLDWVNRNLEGIHLNTAKPGHTILIWLASRVFGFRDYTPLLVAGFFGLLSVGMVFLVGKVFFGHWEGLLAAAALATSEYAVMYSRSGLAEADSSFFFLPAMLFYYLSVRGHRRRGLMLALAGFFIGLGYVSNWRWALVPIVFVLYELYLFATKRDNPFGQRAKRLLILGAGMVLPPLLMEAPYRLIILIAGKVPYYPFTYFEQLADRHRRYGGSFNLKDSLDYVRYLWSFEGGLVFALVAIGLAMLLLRLRRQRQTQDIIVFGQFVVPIIFWSVYSSYGARFPRSLVTALPSAALLAGVAGTALAARVSTLLRAPGAAPAIPTLLLLAIVAFGSARSWSLLSMRSGYRQAVAEAAAYSLKTGKPVSADLFHWPVWKFYAQETARANEVPLEKLVVQQDGAVSGFVPVAIGSLLDATASRLATLRKIQSEQRPVVKVANRIGTPHLYEAGLRWGRVAQMLPSEDIRLIQVYDIP